MSYPADKLVRMANQIADFFAPYAESEAVAGVEQHIRAFWTPGMRRDLLAFVDAGGTGLKPPVVAALVGLRGDGKSPISKVTKGPETLGQATSDAG
jgi:formate dehydrogenase subunit delta